MAILDEIKELQATGKIHPPKWLMDNTQYLCIMGSVAYGCSDDLSDCDVYGWTIPSKETVFPHLAGEVFGFGKEKKRFDVWQEHHVKLENASGELVRECDFTIYSIVRYFHLLLENNPNMLDSLFVPERCILKCSKIAQMVRERRTEFIHKGCWPKLKGYSYSQLHKIGLIVHVTGSKRRELIEKYGYDTKFSYHVVRLMLEAEQLLTERDLDLERHKEQYKAIRRGEWSVEQITEFFQQKEKSLEKLYNECDLPYSAAAIESDIKALLMQCLEEHYGSIDKVINTNKDSLVLLQIRKLLE